VKNRQAYRSEQREHWHTEEGETDIKTNRKNTIRQLYQGTPVEMTGRDT